jgi:hypothetical protein
VGHDRIVGLARTSRAGQPTVRCVRLKSCVQAHHRPSGELCSASWPGLPQNRESATSPKRWKSQPTSRAGRRRCRQVRWSDARRSVKSRAVATSRAPRAASPLVWSNSCPPSWSGFRHAPFDRAAGGGSRRVARRACDVRRWSLLLRAPLLSMSKRPRRRNPSQGSGGRHRRDESHPQGETPCRDHRHPPR